MKEKSGDFNCQNCSVKNDPDTVMRTIDGEI